MPSSLPILDALPTTTAPPEAAIDQTPAQYFANIRYVTLKVTNGCNLSCRYCNVEADLPSTPRMSLSTFKEVATLLICHSRYKELGLEFHGGEPLLMSDEWLTEAVHFAQRLALEHGKKVTFPMQTNGTLLSEARLQTLRALGIRIGLSIDGPPHINDHLRSAGRAAERALRHLIATDPSTGVIVVLSPSNVLHLHEIMEWFRSLGLNGFRINVLQPQGWGTTQPILSANEMLQGFQTIFEHILSTHASIIEADTELMINRFALGRLRPAPKTCWEYECQAGRSYCAVNHDGDVFACGTDMSKHMLGHIHRGFQTLHMQRTLRRLHHKDKWYMSCFDCEAHRICSLSCPTSDFNDTSFREASCMFTKKFYAFLAERRPDALRIYHMLREKKPRPRLS